MKRAVYLILAMAMCLSLCACGKSEAASAFETEVAEISAVSLNSKDAILAAENTYSALSSEDKETVSESKAVLDEKRAEYDALLLKAQEQSIKKADSSLKELAEISAKAIPTTYESEIKVVNGKKLYIGTWDHPIAEFAGDADRFLNSIIQPIQSYTMPTLEMYFSDCDMYAVIYIKMMGQEKCRIIDSRLDSGVAGKLN